MFIRKIVFSLVLACSLWAPLTLADEGMLFELRTYTTDEGRLDALHTRFREHTMALFERHGMRNVGYWIPAETANTLIYIVAHTDAAAAKKSWADFVADPGWKKVYANSIADGPIVNNIDSVFMNAADYSPLQ